MTRSSQLWEELEEGHSRSRGGQVPRPRGKEKLSVLESKKKPSVVDMGVCAGGVGRRRDERSGRTQVRSGFVGHGEPRGVS